MTYGQSITLLNRLYDFVPSDVTVSNFLPGNLQAALPVDKLIVAAKESSEALKQILEQEERMVPAQRLAVFSLLGDEFKEGKLDGEGVVEHLEELPAQTLRLVRDYMGLGVFEEEVVGRIKEMVDDDEEVGMMAINNLSPGQV